MADNPVDETSEDEEDAEFDVGFHIESAAESYGERLRGATWRWIKWTPTPAILYEPETGPTILYDPKTDEHAPYDPSRESPSFFSHDHCHFCFENRMSSDTSEFDVPYGWTTTRPPGIPEAERNDYVYWVCSRCFELLNERFDWKTEPPTLTS